MKRVTVKIWTSDGGHAVPALRAVQKINSRYKKDHRRETFAFHTHNFGGNNWLLSGPSTFISAMLFNFLCSNYGELDLLALSDFPGLSLVKIQQSFHDIKMTELVIILLWLQGNPPPHPHPHIMKVLFHKKLYRIWGVYENLHTLLQKSWYSSWHVAQRSGRLKEC